MRHVVLALLMTMIAVAGDTQTNCKSIHDGNFKSVSELDGDSTVYHITRKKDKQYEEVKSTGVKMEFKVKWTSDCTYELSHPKVIKGTMPGVEDSQVIYVKVIDVREDSYTAEVTANFADFKIMVSYLKVR
jgi:hypothetical protein